MEYIPLKYGLKTTVSHSPQLRDENGKSRWDIQNEKTRLTVRVLDLLLEAENGELSAQNAIEALEGAAAVIRRYQTRIFLGALLPSTNEGPSHSESDHQSEC